MKFFCLVFLMIVQLAVSKNVKFYCDIPGICLVLFYHIFIYLNNIIYIYLVFYIFKNNFCSLYLVTNLEWNIDWNHGRMLEILPRNWKLQMDVLFCRGQKLRCLPTLQGNYGNEWLYYEPSWMFISWPDEKKIILKFCNFKNVVTKFFLCKYINVYYLWFIFPCKFVYYTEGQKNCIIVQ